MKDFETYVEENHGEVLKLLRQLCAVPAPSHHEEKRSEFCRDWLERHGAEGAFLDDAKNVIWEYGCADGGPVALFLAHIDTVFPDTEPMSVEERGGRLYSPGAGDDTANVAILLLTAAYLAEYRPAAKCGIVIAANSCEEGLGNLMGSRALIQRYRGRLLQSVSFDAYTDGICTRAVGSVRWRVEVKTEGGHSYFNFGNRNAIAVLAQMIGRLYEFPLEGLQGKTTYNVGTVSGGTSVNSIAQQAEMLFEFRSDSRADLDLAQKYFEETLQSFRGTAEVNAEVLGLRPCGSGSLSDPRQERLQNFCRDVIRNRTGRTPEFVSASTDSNIPFSEGIPAVTVGLCEGGNPHTRQEWVDLESLKPGFRIAADIIGERLAQENAPQEKEKRN